MTKGTYISDEAFIPAFDEQRGRETVDFDSMLRLERTGERTQFALELSGSPNDFFGAEHLLQSPGYAVDKIPEASFVSVTHDPFEETMPGIFNYQFEASVGAMRLRFSEPTAAEYGFDTVGLAMGAFGTAPGVSLADTQRAAHQHLGTRNVLLLPSTGVDRGDGIGEIGPPTEQCSVQIVLCAE